MSHITRPELYTTREEVLEMIKTYGLLKKKQGKAENMLQAQKNTATRVGLDGWYANEEWVKAEPYDLRCDADELLQKISDHLPEFC